MTGREKLYFLLDEINDASGNTPAGQSLRINPTTALNRKYSPYELTNIFVKLERDDQALQILKTLMEDFDLYEYSGDGCWYIKLLPTFDSYYLKVQYEPEYQRFTGKKPTVPIRTTLSRKSLEKILTVLQEIEALAIFLRSLRDGVLIPCSIEPI